MDNKSIFVTEAFVPPLKEYSEILQRVFDSKWLTNRGPCTLELEQKLKEYLSVSNLFLLTNGTIPIQLALRLFGQAGEVITTPFSYVATTSSIIWQNCKPVFVDIDPLHLTIDENKIEEAINENTTAILATHVFGNPCHVEEIEKIAHKHNLKVIYDAAHCFSVRYKDKSIFRFGDISTISFHATKLFHTGEGGAVFANDDKILNDLYNAHNFGHDGPEKFHGVGINGKISELQSALGLSILPYIDLIIENRKSIVENYDSLLNLERIQKLKIRKGTAWNYSYYPVIFESEDILLNVQNKLSQQNIYPRRYFYPSLNTLPYVEKKNMPIAEDIASRVLCLPLYYKLPIYIVKKISKLINEEL